jgi:hypothetical protein
MQFILGERSSIGERLADILLVAVGEFLDNLRRRQTVENPEFPKKDARPRVDRALDPSPAGG